MDADLRPLWLANEARTSAHTLEVRDKFDGRVAARVARADAALLEEAIAACVAAAPALRRLPACERRDVLLHCARRFEERAEELAQLLCTEAGKPIRDSRGEVGRLVDTFRIAAEEATRIGGELLPMDVTPRATAHRAMWQRVPIGPCSFITPFNFPLNLVAHKVAPAIAAGCPFVLKPASATPLGALVIGEVLAETQLPAGAFSILPMNSADAAPLCEDERFQLLSFTGSPDVGWELKRRAGKKKVALELGGNAAVIVDRDADLADTVQRIASGAFYQSGQSCIKTQRILVHEELYERFRAELVAAARSWKCGDPHREETFLGPLITEGDALRLEQWITEARAAGAKLLCGGTRAGALLEATLLEDVPEDAQLVCAEAFGPVAVLSRFRDFDAALAQVNRSRFGLQAGVFTRDLYKAQRAWDELEVGAVLIGDVPSFRVDHMPYGGVKDSGTGREGPRFAIEEMTQLRMLVIRTP
ncbi:MAG: aldehyde dehydrogenase family protein [Planctomycetes bacterium]|nr:aldehyde dehydrogenase family protein [Planctomycetota bacterium]